MKLTESQLRLIIREEIASSWLDEGMKKLAEKAVHVAHTSEDNFLETARIAYGNAEANPPGFEDPSKDKWWYRPTG